MTSGLATLVAGIWTEAGYETTISHRDGDTYVLAEHESGRTYDLLWILGPDETITADHVERFRARIVDLDVAEAYVVAPTSVADDLERRARRRGVEAVGIETLRSLADQSGVGQVAVDAALATTVGSDDRTTAGSQRTGGDGEPAAEDADADGSSIARGDPVDPDRQAEIRQRLAVMIGDAEPDDEPMVAGDGGDESSAGDGTTTDSDDGEETSESGAGSDGSTGTDDGIASSDDAADASEGGVADPFADPELPGDPDLPDGEEDDDGGRGPLSARRGLITGGVAAVLTAGVLDFTVFNVLLGGDGGGMPAYNETRVKTEAVTYEPSAIMADPAGFEDVAVTYDDAAVTLVESDGSLWSVTLAVSGGTVVGRWDGDEPANGSGYQVWGVVTGSTSVDGEEVPAIDVVDLTRGDAPGDGELTTGTTNGTETSGG